MNGTGKPQARILHKEAVIFVIILLCIVWSRWYGLGQWPVEEDEIFTYSRSVTGNYSFYFPATYWLTAFFFTWLGPSELTLRLPSFLFGVASFPVLYLLTRRLFNAQAAILTGILLLVSPYHLYHSQYGRYYAAVFFIATVTYYFLYLYFSRNSMPALAAALGLSLTGTLFHPTFLFLPVSALLFSIFINLTSVANNRLFDWPGQTRKAAKNFTTLSFVLGIAALIYGLVIYNSWSQFSCHEGGGWGYSFVWFFLQVCKYFGIPICGLAFFGLLHLYTTNIFKALFFQFLIATPILIATAISGLVDVRPDYIIVAFPLCLILTGWLLQEIWSQQQSVLLPAIGVVTALIMALFPGFVSNYTGRATLDPRQAVSFIEKRYQPEDKVVSFSSGFSFYGKKYFPTLVWIGCSYEQSTVKKLEKNFSHPDRRTWFILQTSRGGSDQAVRAWLDHHARLEQEILEKRYDYTYRGLRVYLLDRESAEWPVERMIGKAEHGDISL